MDENFLIKRKMVTYANMYYRMNGFSPSVREIAEELGIGKSTVHNWLRQMNDEGTVIYDGKDIKTYQTMHSCMKYFSAPIIGDINCGNPESEEEYVTEYVRLPESIFGHGEHYILIARGDSMVDAGIEDGDYVVIEKTNTCKVGDIVVALSGENENTLKCYAGHVDGKERLDYMNEEVYPGKYIELNSLIVQGVARTVIKQTKSKY